MKLEEAISPFGTQQKLAEALGIKQGSIPSWDPDRIPLARALQVEKLTGGKLRVDMTLYRHKSRRNPQQAA
jgi:DNA-binding transcriptional regulator YdaS (Cro superfamily)